MMLRLRSPKAQRLRCVGNLPFVMKVVFFFLTKKGKKDISFMCESAGIYSSNTDMCLSILYLECIYVYIYIQYVQDMLSDINQPTSKNSTIASSFSSWKEKMVFLPRQNVD